MFVLLYGVRVAAATRRFLFQTASHSNTTLAYPSGSEIQSGNELPHSKRLRFGNIVGDSQLVGCQDRNFADSYSTATPRRPFLT
jgi:hypothetical protein